MPNTTSVSHVAVASGLGSALTTVLVWVLSLQGLTPPAEVADAFSVIVTISVAVVSSVLMKKFGILSN